MLLYFILFVVIIAGGWYYYKQTTSTQRVLTITENGISFTESYQIMPTRENYLSRPIVESCYTESGPSPDFCNKHERNNQGFVYVYDLSSTPNNPTMYTECPGGGHDCWYVERYNDNGTIVDITNKDGVRLLEKMADDLWSDKWDMQSGIVSTLDNIEYKDGKLISKSESSGLPVGTELTMNDIVGETGSASAYFMAILVVMKRANLPKPDRIVLNIANAKEEFNNSITKFKAMRTMGSPRNMVASSAHPEATIQETTAHPEATGPETTTVQGMNI